MTPWNSGGSAGVDCLPPLAVCDGVPGAVATLGRKGGSIIASDLFEDRFPDHVVRVGARKAFGNRFTQLGEKFGPEGGHRAVGGPEVHGPCGEQRPAVGRQIAFPDQFAAIEPAVMGAVGEIVGEPDIRSGACDGACDAGRIAQPHGYGTRHIASRGGGAEKLRQTDEPHSVFGSRFEHRIAALAVQHDPHVGEVERPVASRGFRDGAAHVRLAADPEQQIAGLQRAGIAGAGEHGREHTYIYNDFFHGQSVVAASKGTNERE